MAPNFEINKIGSWLPWQWLLSNLTKIWTFCDFGMSLQGLHSKHVSHIRGLSLIDYFPPWWFYFCLKIFCYWLIEALYLHTREIHKLFPNIPDWCTKNKQKRCELITTKKINRYQLCILIYIGTMYEYIGLNLWWVSSDKHQR